MPPCSLLTYPSSVNRGYFSYAVKRRWSGMLPPSIHPLSIEAISPTNNRARSTNEEFLVSILCQSRLFLLLSCCRITGKSDVMYPSSVNRGYFSYQLLSRVQFVKIQSIHPLSIEAISPTRGSNALGICLSLVSILCQSRLFLLLRVLRIESNHRCNVSILCQSRLFLLLGSGPAGRA